MARKSEPRRTSSSPSGSIDTSMTWIRRIDELQYRLTVCPTDILSRCQLAMVLERLAQHEDALFNWKAVLACDPNNLTAREGVVRCRQRTGRPLQSIV